VERGGGEKNGGLGEKGKNPIILRSSLTVTWKEGTRHIPLGERREKGLGATLGE